MKNCCPNCNKALKRDKEGRLAFCKCADSKKSFKRRIKKGVNRGKKSTVVIMDKKTKMKHRRNNKGMFFADLTKEYCPQA